MNSPTLPLSDALLSQNLKLLIIQECEKDNLSIDTWSDEAPLFGPHSTINLDSLDALQLCVALQAHYGIRLQGDRMVRQHMMSIADLMRFMRTTHA